MSAEPQGQLRAIANVDGSSIYSFPGYKIACVVNGPLEAPRREEIPHQMHVDVHVRPAVGVGGPYYKRVEQLLHSIITSTLFLRTYPRTLLQITLQILEQPANSLLSPPSLSNSHPQSAFGLRLLPHLLHAAELALLDACIPMSTVLTSTALSLDESGAPTTDPSRATSTHLFAFAPASGKCVFVESVGEFDTDEYRQAFEISKRVCCAGQARDDEMDTLDDGDGVNLERWLRNTVSESVQKQQRWKAPVPQEADV